MLVLALDSASDKLKAGVATEREILSSYSGPPDRTHSEKIIGVLDKLLADADISPSDIDSLAIANGPGSFTGLRIGMASMLGLAKAWSKKIRVAGNQELEREFFARRGIEPVVIISCRADQFYVSSRGESLEISSADQIVRQFSRRQICGPGTDKLKAILAEDARDANLSFTEPSSYSGGELAQIFATDTERYDIVDLLDPVINYLMKSQPEMKRDAARKKSDNRRDV